MKNSQVFFAYLSCHRVMTVINIMHVTCRRNSPSQDKRDINELFTYTERTRQKQKVPSEGMVK